MQSHWWKSFLTNTKGSISFESLWAGLVVVFFFAPTTYLYQVSQTHLDASWAGRSAAMNQAINGNCNGEIFLPVPVGLNTGVHSTTIIDCTSQDGEKDMPSDDKFWKKLDTVSNAKFSNFTRDMKDKGDINIHQGRTTVIYSKGLELGESQSNGLLGSIRSAISTSTPKQSALLAPSTDYYTFDKAHWKAGHDKRVWEEFSSDAKKLFPNVYPSSGAGPATGRNSQSGSSITTPPQTSSVSSGSDGTQTAGLSNTGSGNSGGSSGGSSSGGSSRGTSFGSGSDNTQMARVPDIGNTQSQGPSSGGGNTGGGNSGGSPQGSGSGSQTAKVSDTGSGQVNKSSKSFGDYGGKDPFSDMGSNPATGSNKVASNTIKADDTKWKASGSGELKQKKSPYKKGPFKEPIEWGNEKGETAKAEAKDGGKSKPEKSAKIGIERSLYKKQSESTELAKGQIGGTTATLSHDVIAYKTDVNAKAEVDFTKKEAVLEASVSSNISAYEIKGTLENPSVLGGEFSSEAKAEVLEAHASAKAGVTVTKDKVKVGGEAKIGANVVKVSGSAKQSWKVPFFDNVKISVVGKGEASVGANASASANASFEDGKWSVGAKIGAALGVGAGVGADLMIEF